MSPKPLIDPNDTDDLMTPDGVRYIRDDDWKSTEEKPLRVTRALYPRPHATLLEIYLWAQSKQRALGDFRFSDDYDGLLLIEDIETEAEIRDRIDNQKKRAQRITDNQQKMLLELIQEHQEYARSVLATLREKTADDVVVNLEGPVHPEDVRHLLKPSGDNVL